jgi:uncharacterized protein (DUF1778 family)
MLDATEDREDERRAQYPDAIRFRLPRGFRDRVKQAAQAERVSVSEFIRRAVRERAATVLSCSCTASAYG